MVMTADQMGRKGGLNRAKNLSAARRKEIAVKASKAAAAARTAKARKWAKREKELSSAVSQLTKDTSALLKKTQAKARTLREFIPPQPRKAKQKAKG